MNNKLKELIEDIKYGIENGTDREGIKIDGIGLSWNNLKLLINEIERLNNIINELEEWLNEMLKHNKKCLEEERGTRHQTLDIIAFNRSAYIKIWEDVLDKIKELENGNK